MAGERSGWEAGLEESGDKGNGKADDVEVVAFNAWNPTRGATLDGVGSGFVHGFAGGDVSIDVFVRGGEKLDGGGFGGDFSVCGGDNGDAGDDAMGAAGEKTKHPGGVGGVFGLAEDLIVEGYGGVGAQDDQRLRVEVRAFPPFSQRARKGWGTQI